MSIKDIWTCERCGVEEISPVRPDRWVAMDLTVRGTGFSERGYVDALHLCPLCNEYFGPDIVQALRQLLRDDGQAHLREGTA